MSFIKFESGTEKERARQELREARDELLKRAERDYKSRQEQKLDATLRGDDKWMLPAVSKKIDEMSKKDRKIQRKLKKAEKKKRKKEKKERKQKKKKHTRSSSTSDSSSSSSDEETKQRKIASDSTSSEDDEWIEKDPNNDRNKIINTEPLKREDWMSGIMIPTYTKTTDDKLNAEKKNIDSYNPAQSTRELNPHWKNGGTGLPTFMKPKNDSDNDEPTNRRTNKEYHKSKYDSGRGNWRKTDPRNSSSGEKESKRRRSRSRERRRRSRSRSRSSREDVKQRSHSPNMDNRQTGGECVQESDAQKVERTNFLTDQQMNELGAKLIKAEIMGMDDVANELKEKLEKARAFRKEYKSNELTKLNETRLKSEKQEKDTILLTTTNSKGASRPVQKHSNNEADLWGGRKARKTKKVETHTDNERTRYFADDEKYDLKRMFENEKYTTGYDQDEEFARIAGQHKNPNDDLEDIFAEKITKGKSDKQHDDRERNRAIKQHQDMARTLESCDKCFDSAKMEKQLIVSMGTNVYLSLPWHEPLQPGHCLIVPMQHVSASTYLDEDVWNEVYQYQQALCQMFRSHSQDVIFFETVKYLHKRPHMTIHCIPNANFEMAPFYFKKAIQESEQEWSTNKQLIELKEKSLRRSIPKGLPYFWVNFGMDNGFAHVIEDQNTFATSFAQEIIGGLLNLDARLWRRPRKISNPIPKVKQFADWWKPYDFV